MTRNQNRIAATPALACLLIGMAVSPGAFAGLILADDGSVFIEANPSPLNTTPVPDPLINPIGSIAFAGGTILLEDYAGSALTADADLLTPGIQNPTWWNAPGVAYTTTTSGIFIDFLNLDVTGFTFNIGANMNAQAWIRAYYDDGDGQHLSTGWFGGIGATATPSYGVYAHAGSCARITRVEVDPTFVWGVGNFGVAQNNSCVSVPEPGTTTLLSLGLLAMGLGHLGHLARRRSRVAA